MSKGLCIATWTAAKRTATADRRKFARCAAPGCRRRVENLPDGTYTAHCTRHMPGAEFQGYYTAWLSKQQ